MKIAPESTRRSFFFKAGAALSAPLATAAAGAAEQRGVDTAARARALAARLSALEDVEAIRELHRRYMRLLDAGARDAAARNAVAREAAAELFVDGARAAVDPFVDASIDPRLCSLRGDGHDARDIIDLARDHETATVQLHCRAEVADPIEPTCTLVEMARAQGEGVVRRVEERVLESVCIKRDGRWRIVRAVLAAG